MITRYVCPLPECGWTHWIRRPQNPAGTLVEEFAEISKTVSRIRGYLDAEKVVTAHLATHTPLQWAAELHRANALVDQLQSRIEPHLGTLPNTDHAAAKKVVTARLKAEAEHIQEVSQGSD